MLSLTATDPAGNTSAATTIPVDQTAPAQPVVAATDGSPISGVAEAGSTVTVTSSAGPVCTAVANASGAWSCIPATTPADGTVLSITATDPATNVSAVATTTVDQTAPVVPTVVPTDGSPISGTAEIGSTVTVSSPSGPVCTAVANAAGAWSCIPATTPANGVVLSVTATDASGNTSAAATSPVDQSAPVAPTVVATDGSPITGTAEAGTQIRITGTGGVLVCTAIADASGNWACTPGTTPTNGTVLSLTSIDPAGNVSNPATTTVDSMAPNAPSMNPTDGSPITGTAEAGSTVTVTSPAGPVCTATADASGNWTCTPATVPTNGTVLSATTTDPAGNTSSTAPITVDAIAPAAPASGPTNGTTISGNAEPGSTVHVVNPATGAPVCSGVTDASGAWTCTPVTAPANGTTLAITTTDPSGNVSPATSVVVDSVLPAAPVAGATDGSPLTGTAEPGTTVTVTSPAGPVCSVVADASGNWTCTPATAPANGTVLSVVSTDAAGNTSTATPVTVDSAAPAAPLVTATDGSPITGTAEAGTTVTVTSPSGPVCSTVADATGHWTCNPVATPANGTILTVTTTDPAGNTSAPATTVTDATAPVTPVAAPSNGSTVAGVAEPGSTVTVTSPSGPVCTAVADASGHFTCTPATAPAEGTVLSIVSTDPAGNASTPTTTVVDSGAPAATAVVPTNGSHIAGSGAEAGSTVKVVDTVTGSTVCTTMADAAGNWSCVPVATPANGHDLAVTVIDLAGNVSPITHVVVDSAAPATPVVAPTNGSTLTGSAEVGAVVVVTSPSGPVCTAIVDASGHWSCTPAATPGHATVLTVTVTDTSGNTSVPATTTVDAVAPVAPVAAPTDGSPITGSAEPGSTITITSVTGKVCSAIADASGHWSCTPVVAPTVGTALAIVAADPAGNISPAATIRVDPPAVPLHIELHDPYTCGGAITGDLSGGAAGLAGAVVTIDLIQGGVVKYTLYPVLDAAGHYEITPDYGTTASGPYQVHVHASVHGESADVNYDATISAVCSKVVGTAFVDSNANGVRDANEGALANATIRLVDQNGNVYTVAANADGTYSLAGIPAGVYTVQVLSDGVVVLTKTVNISGVNSVLDLSVRRVDLPATGSDSLDMLQAAFLLTMVGGMIVMIGRRRRPTVR